MNRHLLKAHDCCRHRHFTKAAACYRKVLHKLSEDNPEFRQAVYMLAYTYSQQAQACHGGMSCLGVDLRHAYQDYYRQAALCLQQLAESHFDPSAEGLPKLDAHAMHEIQDALFDTQQQETEKVVDYQWLDELALQPIAVTVH